jgi:hypothetical protein
MAQIVSGRRSAVFSVGIALLGPETLKAVFFALMIGIARL